MKIFSQNFFKGKRKKKMSTDFSHVIIKALKKVGLFDMAIKSNEARNVTDMTREKDRDIFHGINKGLCPVIHCPGF